ncbi:MAG: serine/threonine protein kinase [Nannocystaceae bacterium]|nr:serine/threonine protein kinase [Nannocystaceae bacterium]
MNRERTLTDPDAIASPRPGAHDDEAAATAQLRHADDAERPGNAEPPRAGRFVLLERAGQGAMGSVWAAYDPQLDRKVAIKFMHGRSTDARVLARVRREGMALARVDHPNVVTVHEVGDEDGRIYVAMDFVGRSIATRLGQRTDDPLRWPEILRIALDAGHGLAAVHAAGLVHRDIKPSNLLLWPDGRVAVADFGLARAGLDDGADFDDALELHSTAPVLNATLTVPGEVVGTPAYMAPEQVVGRVDARADQFALAVTLWEVAFGVRPFDARTLAERIDAIERGELQAPADHGDVPRWFERILRRALAFDPAARFDDVPQMLAAMQAARARARRRPILLGVAAAAVVVGSALGFAAWRDAQRCRDGAALLGAAAALPAGEPGVVEAIDTVARGWVDRYERACRVSLANDVSLPHDRIASERSPALACLAEAREALTVAAETLAQTREGGAALAALPRLADCDALLAAGTSSDGTATAAWIEAARAEALAAAGHIDEATAALASAPRADDAGARARLELVRAVVALARADAATAADAAEVALAQAERARDRRLAARAYDVGARAALAQGQPRRAALLAAAALASAGPGGLPSVAESASQTLAAAGP